MILHNEYLTDEELELLISEAEDDLMQAPPELADKIITCIKDTPQLKAVGKVSETKPENVKNKKTGKQREFASYCFRVAMSVAAAIAFMCIMPNLPGFAETSSGEERQEYTDKETFLKENGVRPRQEVYEEYPSREEVLNDKSMMQRLLDGEKIFGGDRNMPEFPKESDEPGTTSENIPTTGNRNIDKANYIYENGGQLL